ncbi:zinc ribbon domain-containing protein [Hahella aquimaris]|uniref:zinc ribbon domain-containing protein n=1 Tax=Hahella sp. HNIBRBA332 TaxID=3015983 RepID=UPI00273C17C0|nr:zinc ribbon domain-containing protein [Hahella sp. HNIBRBA332]WLQ13882.1 zinc ribbon domain-containing protein [Hahella sp. HNIBRBA332]
MAFSKLEQNILKAKGLSDDNIQALVDAGIESKQDFHTVGDAGTLAALSGLDPNVAAEVMAWAVGPQAATSTSASSSILNPSVVVESADIVKCAHCQHRQPKDYKSGDLCVSCGRQVERFATCHWCAASGPGNFCRSCGAEFVPVADFEIAVMLKREGVAKDQIAQRVRDLSADEKDTLWGRIRSLRGHS